MKIINIIPKTKLEISNIKGFIKRKVTTFGTGAKVDCPKEYLGQEVYLVIIKNESKKESKRVRRKITKSSSKNRRT